MRFCRRLTSLAILAGGLALVGSTPARAAFTLTLHDTLTGDDLVVNDRIGAIGDPNDLAKAGGTIQFTDQFGNFDVNITIHTTSPGTGPGGPMVQDVTITTNNIGSTSDTLTASVNSDGFTSPNQVGTMVGLMSALASSNVSSGGSATFVSALNGQPTSPTLFLNKIDAVTAQTAVTITSVPYTLTNTLAISLGAGGTAQFTGTTTVTPEPGTLAMASSSLAIFGLVRLRRRKKV